MSTIHLELRYVEIEYELLGLRQLLDRMEPTIKRLAAQTRKETLAELRRNEWDHDEAELDMAFQQIRDVRQRVLPRFLRGPFLVSLWACYESGIRIVAGQRGRELGVSGRIRGRTNEPLIVRARQFLAEGLQLDLEPDRSRFDRLADLGHVRNGLAHANGMREGMTDGTWLAFVQALERGGVHLEKRETAPVLPASYVRGAFEDVNASLRNLVIQARSDTHEEAS